MNITLTIVGMALVTFATRAVAPLLLRGELPVWLRRWLSFVPIAVYVALILPPLMLDEHSASRSMTFSPALPAGVVGAFVAWRTNNVLLTLAAGFAAFWLVKLVI